MSTIASPRPSVSLSSRRTSVSTEETARRSVSTTRAAGLGPGPATGNLRRNRAALRDYYGLKANAAASNQDAAPVAATAPAVEVEKESELDKEGFDPQAHVHKLLSTESLEGILRAEAALVAEIRGLDGERKALVYDNYSKLIAATETIRKMRTNMDPLTPTTATLEPAIGHIAEVAVGLSKDLQNSRLSSDGAEDGSAAAAEKRNQQQTVRWVLDTPERMRKMLAEGRKADAEAEWEDVSTLLDKWDNVKGVAELREKGQSLLRSAT
ncbi:hypothetical protein MBLNU230_g1444t1 [Neophaeotheca triangularis]